METKPYNENIIHRHAHNIHKGHLNSLVEINKEILQATKKPTKYRKKKP